MNVGMGTPGKIADLVLLDADPLADIHMPGSEARIWRQPHGVNSAMPMPSNGAAVSPVARSTTARYATPTASAEGCS